MEGIFIITILVILYPHIKRGVDELVDDLLFIVKGLLLMLTIAIAKIIRMSKKIVWKTYLMKEKGVALKN